ncbi:MAG: HDOD domain-containing protein [Methylobacterium sp.]|nr:HDOD domain-containing protein [Methylobacterium sp.]
MSQDRIDFAELKASGVLPSPKGVALTVMRLCQRENVSLHELAHAIQGDPVMAGRLIRIANIANPNKSRPIASLTSDTLILVGIHAVRQVVLGFSLVSSYRSGDCHGFDFARFWSASAAMASAAQAIGGATRLAPPAELFICGLLAGVGRLCLAVVRPVAYAELLADRDGKSPDIIAGEESARFGINHSQLSAAMMEDWGFPGMFIDAVACHENPQISRLSEGSRPRRLAYALQLAALLGNALPEARTGAIRLSPGMLEVARLLSLTPEQTVAIAGQSARDWREWGVLLNIETQVISEIALPDPNAGPAASGRGAPAALPAVRPMRILVADDDETLVFMINKLLSAAGHTVYTDCDFSFEFRLARIHRNGLGCLFEFKLIWFVGFPVQFNISGLYIGVFNFADCFGFYGKAAAECINRIGKEYEIV